MRGARAAGVVFFALGVAVAAADMRSAPAAGGARNAAPDVAPGQPGEPAQPGAPGQPGQHGGIDVWVPIDPAPSEHMYWKRRSPRSAVPGAIVIDRDAYVCDLHRRSFADAERFAAHLRVEHRVPADRIRDVLVEVDGVYHYAGE